ncbi:FKBP-like protein [Annulohypoxylon maeteangense]|uniref:FKBP-like protein n=1 Tax=Annulohypoxylon maeteangense TaxID=1927788 RepID=UPI002007609E|nr:FKBP-like protein [Annulohypoxylon maeteangense]KAI0887356.1 FKBP-like protein [Annulohypoxylon maeteangense]
MAPKKKADKKSNDKDAGGKGKDDKNEGKGKGGQAVLVRHILCEKHGKKEEAFAEIMKTPTLDHFITVARIFSEDKAKQGGLLGWQRKGQLAPEFEKVAFVLQESKGSNLFIGQAKTAFGYHLIVVEGYR